MRNFSPTIGLALAMTLGCVSSKGGGVDPPPSSSDDSGETGDDNGDDTGGNGDDTGSNGDDTGGNGDDTGSSGDDTGSSGDDTGESPGPIGASGICKDLGGSDGGLEPMSDCLEPTGVGWNAASWQTACEDDWDHNGVWAEEALCISRDRVGQCTDIDGGALIGASFDGMAYAGTWVYYSTQYTARAAESHCAGRGGSWSAAE